MFEIIDKSQKPFPVERAILLSIVAHILVVIALVTAPPSGAAGSRPSGLLAALLPAETKEPPIPVVFRESPGPARENPRRSDLSDADRRAGGGDPSRGKSETPFFAPRPGVEGLSPGAPGAESRAPAPAPPPFAPGRSPEPGRGPEPENRAAVFGPTGGGDSKSPVLPRAEEGGGAESGRLASLDRAIRDAARNATGGGGQDGAGFPNPDGGYVDSGPLSFDTTWYDWGPYAAEMVRRIKLHWEIPELARLGWKGKLTIRFFILADGRVADATIIRRSGVPPFDFAALQAILKSSPFRPLPADLGSSREGVTVTFYYNIRPERAGPPDGTQ